MLAFLAAVIPTAGVLFLFWLGIRAMLRADRAERQAMARMESTGNSRRPAPADAEDDGEETGR